MKFIIDKESFLNKIRIVEKVTVNNKIQPVLSNILIKAKENEITLVSTDLDITILAKTTASIEKEGEITLPAKKLFEIISKLPDKPIEVELKESNNVSIKCGNSKFEIIGISASEFPQYKIEEEGKETEIETEPFVNAIKYTTYATAGYETRNIISGVFCQIKENELEMAATDGNRLTRRIEKLNKKEENEQKIVIPSKTLNEFLRIASFVFEKKVNIINDKKRIILKTNSFVIISRLLEGEYPPYKQLIPQSFEKTAVLKRTELIESLERVSVMVNEKTNIIKFIFKEGSLKLEAQTPDTGMCEEELKADYEKEELKIAFNYRYVLESLKIIEEDNIKIGLGGSLSATVFKPEKD